MATRAMTTADSDEGTIFWKVGTPLPDELKSSSSGPDLFASVLVPRMLAWVTVGTDNVVALLDGYNAGSYTPPSLFFGASALPRAFVETLQETKVCTVCLATEHDPAGAAQQATAASCTADWGAPDADPPTLALSDLGLETVHNKKDYPPAIQSSPIHMLCRLEKSVTVSVDNDDSGGGTQTILVFVVESFVMAGSILVPPPPALTKQRPGVTAKIDVTRIRPAVRVHDRVCPLQEIRSMPRPVKQESSWTSTPFATRAEPCPDGNFDTAEWNFAEHGGTSPLGYNAVTALVLPRPIGWISTYHRPDDADAKIAHLAPYSFFANVSRSEPLLVAFSGYCKDQGTTPKDAQFDAERTGAFVCNLVTEGLAEAMNLSAAELPRSESEFALSPTTLQSVANAALVDAPIVAASPIRLECRYVQSIPIGSFSIVVGHVLGIGVDKRVITAGGGKKIDPVKLQAITRLGFLDEYGTLDL